MNKTEMKRRAWGLVIVAALCLSTSVVLARDTAQIQPTETEPELTLVAATLPEGIDPDLLVPLGVDYSPDGARLVTSVLTHTPIVWDATTGEQLLELEGHTAHARWTSWSPDGAIIAGGSDDGTVILWDADSGDVLHTLDAGFLLTNGVAFSPDSSRIATTSGIDDVLRIWDVATGNLLSTITFDRMPFFVAWSPDGAQIAVSSMTDDIGGKIFIYDPDSGELVMDLTMPDSNTTGLTYSPDGTRLLSGAFQAELAQEWDVATGEPSMTFLGHTQPVVFADYSPDGTLIATSSWDGARLWDAATGEELLLLTALPMGIPRAIFSPDGTHLVTMQLDGLARIYKLADLLNQ